MTSAKYISLFSAALLIAATITGCQKAANTNTAANQAGNTSAANTNAATPAAAKTPETSSAAISLATPTDAYKAAYALREKKDVEGLKKVFSKDVLDFLTDIGKSEKKSLDDEITAMFDSPQAKTAEARNEKINGDKASVEYLAADGSWKTMDFVKDGSDWKMTIPKMDKPTEDGPPKK